QRGGPRGAAAGAGLATAAPAGALPGGDPAAAAAGERQAGGGAPQGLHGHPPGGRGGGGVQLPARRLPPGLPGGGAAQAPGPGEARAESRGGGAVLLLPHQPVDLGAGRGGLLRQRPRQPGEPDRAAQERGAGAAGAGEHAGGQRGLHGDRLVGLEPEGLAGVAAAAGGRPAGADDDGVQEVPAGGGAAAVPGGARRAAAGVPAAAMEPVGGRPVPGRGGAAPAALRLRPVPGSRGPDASIRAGAKPKKGSQAWVTDSGVSSGHRASGAVEVLSPGAAAGMRPAPREHACFGTSAARTGPTGASSRPSGCWPRYATWRCRSCWPRSTLPRSSRSTSAREGRARGAPVLSSLGPLMG